MGSVRLGIDGDLALALRDHFKLKYFVETGTWKGGTATWAADHFERVFTIEGWQKRWLGLTARLELAYPNISFLFGDSRTKLAEVLAGFDEPVLLWLDAHWLGDSRIAHEQKDECPIREELQAVNAHPFAANMVILIDDARLFTAPPPYPHDPDQWPNIDEVIGLLSEYPRFIHIHEDVIYAIPASAKDWFRKQIGVS